MESNFLHLYDEIKNVAKPLSTSSEQQSENLAQIPTRSETGRILFPGFTRVLLFDSFERVSIRFQRGANATDAETSTRARWVFVRSIRRCGRSFTQEIRSVFTSRRRGGRVSLGEFKETDRFAALSLATNDFTTETTTEDTDAMTRDSIRHEKIAFSRRERRVVTVFMRRVVSNVILCSFYLYARIFCYDERRYGNKGNSFTFLQDLQLLSSTSVFHKLTLVALNDSS